MNLWKPIALCSVAVFGLTIANQFTSVASVASAAGVCHDQPNMAAAAAELRSAVASLGKAEHNKGGWRVAATEAAQKALAETDRGCAFADK
jgi:hypothetical protein